MIGCDRFILAPAAEYLVSEAALRFARAMEGGPAEAAGLEGGRPITQWCRHFFGPGCQRGRFCTFAHHETDFGKTYLMRDQWVSTHKMVLCKWHASGKMCGPGCRFAHGEQELGQPLVKNADLHAPLARSDKTPDACTPRPPMLQHGMFDAAQPRGWWSDEAKTEERTENDNEEWTKIEECTKGGGWTVLTAWECAKIVEESWMKVSGQECKQEKEDKSEERDLPP